MSAQEVSGELPGYPSLIRPSNGQSIEFYPSFRWSEVTASPSVTSYHLVVDNNDNFSSPVISISTQENGHDRYSSSQRLDPGTYYWKVQATNSEGDGPFSNTQTFMIEDADAPETSLLSPADGGFTNDQTPRFDWKESLDASGINRYTIQVSTSSTFSTPVINTNIDGSPPEFTFTPATNLAEGAYFWRVRAMDSAGNVGSYSNTRSFTIDVTAPAAPTLNTPTNLAIINDNTPAFDWSDIVDPSTPVRYHLALDTESAFEYPSIISNLFSTSTATVTPLTALSDGVYFWKVAVLDAAGNLGADSSIYSFTIDTVSPDTTINSRIDGNNNPVINNGTTTSNSITFSFSGTPSSDINNLECSIDGSNFITCSSPTQFSNLTESVHTFRVRAVDALGNVDQTPAEHKWTVDHTGPTVTASPATGTFASNQSVALSSTATDLDAIYYTTDGSTPDNTDAEYAGPISISSTTTIKFIGYDTLGNAGPVGTETYTIDTQPPNTSLLSPNGAITNDQTPRFDWRDSIDTGGISRYTIQVSPSSSFSTTIIDVNIDGSPPESSFTPVTNLSLGTYFWRVQAVDGVGNVGPYSNTLSFTITNDFTGPTAPSLIAPANNGFTKTASLEFDWTDATDPSGIHRYTIQGSANPTLSEAVGSSFATPIFTQHLIGDSAIPFVLLDDLFYPSHGTTYYWHVKADDRLGNIGLYSQTFSFTIDDIRPNNFDLIFPTNEGIITDNTPTFEWENVEHGGEVLYELLVDTENTFTQPLVISQDSLPNTTFTPSSPFADWEFFWKVRAIDVAGNIGPFSSISSFMIDTVPPDTTINSRIDGNNNPVINNSITASNSITFSFSDTPSSDTDFECSIDGSNFTTCTSPTQINNLTECLHTFRVRAADAVGNVDQTPAEHRWTVDVTGPTVIASPATGTFAVNQSVTLSSTATDLDAIYYTTDGSTPDNTDTEYTGPISISSTTTLKFIGYDTLGNAGPVGTETYTIVIDNTGPTVTASRATGPFGVAFGVTLWSTATDLDAIYYTTDGSTPDNTDTEYTGPISISSTTTLKFIGYDTLGNAGPVGTETYTIVVTPSDIDTSLSLKLSTNIDIPHKLIPKSLHGLLDSAANIPITGGSKYTASGKLTDSVTNKPISGKTITITTDGSSPVIATTNDKGIFTVQLTAPNFPGKHDIVASFAGDTQYSSSNSPVRKLVVIGVSHLTLLTLKLDSNIIVAPGSSYSVSGKLLGMVGSVPLSGKTITITTDGSSPVSATTNNKGVFTVQLKAPVIPGLHSIKAYFAGDSQYKPTESPIVKIFVKGNNPAIDKTASLDLRLEGKNKMTSDSTYTVTGKLIDALSKKPIPGKVISVKTNDGSPQVTDTTDKKGKFEVKLKAPGSSGEYDIKAYFAGDSQHKPAESQIAKITVEGNKLENKKSGATTDEQETDEQETDEQQSDEQQESEQETDEQETDEQESDEQQETDEQQESEQETDEQE